MVCEELKTEMIFFFRKSCLLWRQMEFILQSIVSEENGTFKILLKLGKILYSGSIKNFASDEILEEEIVTYFRYQQVRNQW